MTMTGVLNRLVDLLVAPEAMLPRAHLSSRRPAHSADLPAVALSLEAGDQPGHTSGSIRQGEETFEVRFTGLLNFEVWATSAEETETLTQALQTRLLQRTLAQAHGFLRLLPVRLSFAENVLQTPVSGASFAVWKQTLAYRIVFEAQERPEPEGEGLIVRIGVELGEEVGEIFTVPASRTETDNDG